jgi:3-oxoacyl-[acyl-carrier protein] reductase
MKKQLLNETALITGSTSGIGKKTAEYLLEQGCKVAICSRNRENVDKTLQEFQEKFGKEQVIGSTCDVSDINSVISFTDEIIKKFGSLRIAIANAGINIKYGPFEHYPLGSVDKDAQKILATNLIGIINTTRVVLDQMKKQKYGRIITLTGGGADRPITNMTLYSASKGGVAAFARCLAEELKEGPEDIKLNIYQPGMHKTNLSKNIEVVPNWKSKEQMNKEAEMAFDYMGGDIEKSVQSILPYILPSCSKNGKQFRGFSLVKLIRGAMKLKKQLK